MSFRVRRREEEGVNPTPMVDVMFNLLIFVIVTAQYGNFQSLKVNLPKAQTGAALEKAENVVIAITRDEKVYLNGRPLTVEKIKEALAPLAKQTDPPRIVLQADAGSTTGKLVQVMDLAQQAGLKKISIETKK